MSYLPDLRASLVAAAERQRTTAQSDAQGAGATSQGWRRLGRGRALLISLALVLGGAAVALAAAGVFQRGAPVGPQVPPVATAYNGVAIPGSVKLLPLRVADPGGGPPWGLRMLHTTRGLTCVQFGRVALGTVGVLGQDGAFANDGRFHPLSRNLTDFPFSCAIADAHGNGFLNVAIRAIPASALIGGPPRIGGCHLAQQRYSGLPQPACPTSDVRDLYYGLLGPDAISITHVTATGRVVTSPTTGPDGAYLVVLPRLRTAGPAAAPARRRESGPRVAAPCDSSGQQIAGGPALAGSVVRSVTYRDGHTCHTHPLGLHGPGRASGACPPVGFVTPSTKPVTAAQLATPIHVRKLPAKTYCAKADIVEPCGAHTRPGFKRLVGGAPSLLVEISFTSRVAIPNSRSLYHFDLTLARSRGCTEGGMGGPSLTDIRTGQRVSTRMFVPYHCPGVVHGSVSYVATTGPDSAMLTPPPIPGRHGSTPVGRFSFTIP
jgi:hypothetical protein